MTLYLKRLKTDLSSQREYPTARPQKRPRTVLRSPETAHLWLLVSAHRSTGVQEVQTKPRTTSQRIPKASAHRRILLHLDLRLYRELLPHLRPLLYSNLMLHHSEMPIVPSMTLRHFPSQLIFQSAHSRPADHPMISHLTHWLVTRIVRVDAKTPSRINKMRRRLQRLPGCPRSLPLSSSRLGNMLAMV